VIKELLKLLRVLFTPHCWLQNQGYSSVYDKSLREALRNPVFSEFGDYTIKLNGVEIWIENYPYSYGMPKSRTGISTFKSNYRSSRRTIFWLHDAIKDFEINGNKTKLKIVNPIKRSN